MAQHDGVIANQGFPAFRSDLNDALAAIFSTHSGTAAPTGVVAGQFWIDTDTPSATVRTLFHYDGTDSIGIMQIDYTNNYIAKFGIGIQPSSMASGTMLHLKAGTSGATADTSADDFVIDVPGSGGMSINGVVGNNVMIALGDGTNGTGSALAYWNGTNKIMRHATNLSGGILVLAAGANTEVLRLAGGTGSEHVYLNDTSDANVSSGYTINQGSNDDALLTAKSSDVAHGITDYLETDSYFGLGKHSSTGGGARLAGYTEDSIGMSAYGSIGSADTTDVTGSGAAIYMQGRLKSGTGVTAIGATGNVFAVGNNDSLVALFKGNGDVHAVDTSWATALDTEDDTGLLHEHFDVVTARAREVQPDGSFFNRLHRLHRLNLVGYVGPRRWAAGERPLVNVTGMVRLLRDEARQRANREAIYVQAQQEQSERLRALEECSNRPAGPTFIERCTELAAGRNVGRLPAPISLS